MSKIRLDDMTIEEVRELYNPMFVELIDSVTLDKIYKEYLYKYNEMKTAEKMDMMHQVAWEENLIIKKTYFMDGILKIFFSC